MTRRRRRERFHARRRHRGGLGGIFGVLGAGWPVAVLVLGGTCRGVELRELTEPCMQVYPSQVARGRHGDMSTDVRDASNAERICKSKP